MGKHCFILKGGTYLPCHTCSCCEVIMQLLGHILIYAAYCTMWSPYVVMPLFYLGCMLKHITLQKLRQGNVYTPVCHSVHKGEGVSGSHSPGQTSPGQTFPHGQTLALGRHTPQADIPSADPPPRQTATAADGMHPTGIYSCWTCYWH